MTEQLEQIATDICDAYNELAEVEQRLILLKTQMRGLRTRLCDIVVTREQEPYKKDTAHELANAADVIEVAIKLLADGPTTGGQLVKEIYELLAHSPSMVALGSDVLLERARNIAQAYLGRVVGEL